MSDFWNKFNSFLSGNIPSIVIEILAASGYDNATALSGLDEKEINEIEKFVHDNLQCLLEKSSQYSTSTRTSNTFSFLPGHKKLLFILGEKAEQYYEMQKKVSSNIYSKCITRNESYENATPLMKELINSMEAISNVAPTGRRYSDACKNFAMYMYMLSGKAAYEALCNNLPLPQAATVCEYSLLKFVFATFTFENLTKKNSRCHQVGYLADKKQKFIEGELRCKELAEYLKQLNAPMEVWIAEDGSGILPNVAYDSNTNQLVGLVLPIDENTGIPISYSFTPQSVNDINNQINSNSKSSLVYLVLAQPILDNTPPFVLQIFGTDNRFKAKDVLKRWKHTADQLSWCVLYFNDYSETNVK